MAKARAIVMRRKSVQNIKKITRTMELIATARFKKALDRATEAEAYTRKIAELVADLGQTADAASVSHPLLEVHDPSEKSLLLILTSNRGLAGGYNGNLLRVSMRRIQEAQAEGEPQTLEVAGKRGLAFLRFRRIKPDTVYTQFEDKPEYAEVEAIAERYIELYTSRQIDKLEVVYTKFVSSSTQEATLETLLPMTAESVGALADPSPTADTPSEKPRRGEPVPYEFIPDAESILREIVPVSFKVRLFKCFLDAAVSEQIARMVAMKGATQNAEDMIKNLTRLYNRARQSQITRELAEIIGGAAALE